MTARLLLATLTLCAAVRGVGAQPANGASNGGGHETHESTIDLHENSPPSGCDRACVIQGAREALAAGEWARAVELYETAQVAQSLAADDWSALGEALFNDGRLRDAVAAWQRTLQLGARVPHRTALDIARAYATMENRRQALRWLEHAVMLGLADRELVRRSPEFEPLRDDARFRALLHTMGATAPTRYA